MCLPRGRRAQEALIITEVETALLALDGIRGCAVIGVPDPQWGEAVTAFVVGDGTIELREHTLIDAVKNQLGSVKAPKSIDIVDQLPHTHNGKIDKKALREPYWRGRQ